MIGPRSVMRVARRGVRLMRFALAALRDQLRCSFAVANPGLVPLARPAMPGFGTRPAGEAATLRALAARSLAHEFDILGSGWRGWARVQPVQINRANRRYAADVAAGLSADYRSIDWHCDRRSGYRFAAARWSRLIQPGPAPGVDIKVPWELSRMHHVVQLALLAVDESTPPDLATACTTEIEDQIRDFIAANPPRFGVNWRVAMDVAIRATNWVLAVSILDAHGRATAACKALLGGSLRDHGRFIIEHLEWDPHWRGNHYLADVCGLAFIAAVLPAGDETDAWLALATGEVLSEGLRQVNADGSGFEGSTSYHRLSLDMLVHTLALLLGVDARRWRSVRSADHRSLRLPAGFAAARNDWSAWLDERDRLQPPAALIERLWRAAYFTRAVSRADGRALLIGDNDSGRFVKPCPRYDVIDALQAAARYPERPVERDAGHDWREIGEDHGHLVRAIDALFGAGDAHAIDAQLIRWLADGRMLAVPATSTGLYRAPAPAADVPRPPPTCNTLELRLPRRVDLDQVGLHGYPGWGLYLLRGDGLLLSFRCGPLGLSGTGNHDHNDQLALTLHVDGRDWIADPGTYRYTADLAERDAYRSVNAHFAPRLRDGDVEPGSLAEGTWRLGDQAQAVIERATDRCLQGRHHGFGAAVHRRIELRDDRLVISDWCDADLVLMPLDEQYEQLDHNGSALRYCPDYGVRCA